MRLIDAELAMHALATFSAIEMATGDRTRECGKGYDVSGVTIGYEQGIKDALAVLHDMPAIEAEPVKHGKWVKDKERDMLRCSVCQNFYVENYMFWFKYCPDCGARMDGDK